MKNKTQNLKTRKNANPRAIRVTMYSPPGG
jgi:hypothetical protein